MNETSQWTDEVRKQLAVQHDAALSALMLNRRQRRSMRVRAPRRDIERFLFATGAAIAQAGEAEKPVYATAKEFLDDNPG